MWAELSLAPCFKGQRWSLADTRGLEDSKKSTAFMDMHRMKWAHALFICQFFLAVLHACTKRGFFWHFVVVVGVFVGFFFSPGLLLSSFHSETEIFLLQNFKIQQWFFGNFYSLALMFFLQEKHFFKIKSRNVGTKNTGLVYNIAKPLSVQTSMRLHDQQDLAVLHDKLDSYYT